MTAATCCFISLNVPLGIIGLLLFAVGTMLGLFDAVVAPMIQPFLDKLPIASGASTNIGVYLTGPSIAFTVIGAVFCTVPVMTCLTFCGKSKSTSVCFVLVYDIVIGILLILTICLIGIIASAETLIGAPLSTYISSTLVNNYISVDNLEPTTLLWNVAQMGLQCCGTSSGADYASAIIYNRTWLTMTDPSDPTSTLNMVIPPTCCTTQFLTDASTAYQTANPSSTNPAAESMKSAQLMANCVFYYQDTSSNYKSGCSDAFWVRFKEYQWYMLGPAIAIFLMLLFLFIVPIVVICKNRREKQMKEEKEEPWRSETPQEDLEDDQDKALRGGHLY